MKAVIGTTFRVQRVRLALVSVPPSGPSPKSFPNVQQIKTKHVERNTTLQSSDFWWAISAGDSSLHGGGPYLALNVKQAATLGYMQPGPLNVVVHGYFHTHELLLCLEVKATHTHTQKRSVLHVINGDKKERSHTHTQLQCKHLPLRSIQQACPSACSHKMEPSQTTDEVILF